ncbi:MAG: glycosyltransferase family 87 protein [Pseudomonadota bacterium]
MNQTTRPAGVILKQQVETILGAWALTSLAVVVLAAGFGFALWRPLQGETGFDLSVFWVAGRLWSDGLSPYDIPVWREAFGTAFPDFYLHAAFFYPPQSWWIFRPLAAFDYELVRIGWGYLAVGLVVLSGLILHRAAPPEHRPDWRITALCLGFLLLNDALGNVIFLGQMGAWVLLGAACIVRGLWRRELLSLIAGVALLTLKPHIALGFLVLPMLMAQPLRVFAWMGAFLGLLLIPAFVVSGVSLPVDYLSGLRFYSSDTHNAALASTGVAHLIVLVSGLELDRMAVALGTAAAVALCLLIGRQSRAEDPWNDVRVFALGTAVLIALASLHPHDTLLFGVLLFLAPFMRLPEALLILFTTLVTMRTAYLTKILELFGAPGDLQKESIEALAYLLCAIGLLALSGNRRSGMRLAAGSSD